jgi:hypothetical protein
MVHNKRRAGVARNAHLTFPLRDCLGKAVWIGLALLGFRPARLRAFTTMRLYWPKRSVEGKVDCVPLERTQ